MVRLSVYYAITICAPDYIIISFATNGMVPNSTPIHNTIIISHRYDFALFGFFSDVIATVFFPPSDDEIVTDDAVDMGGEIDTKNLLKSFAVYGGAFIMRPIGGLIIGFIGDKV